RPRGCVDASCSSGVVPTRCCSPSSKRFAGDWRADSRKVAAMEPASFAHRLLADIGVIVVEVTQAVRASDFDELAVTADTWIEAHGQLQGLVIHARRFPGGRA